MRCTRVKIAIIGAGSAQFSGDVIRDICVTPGLHGSQVVLMDIDQNRLEFIQILAEKLNREMNAKLHFLITTDRTEAIKNADFVINTVLVGGHHADMSFLEAFVKRGLDPQNNYPLWCMSQMPFHLGLAKEMEIYCPNAWLIMSANPVFEGCTYIHRNSSIKVLGLCHGHYGIDKVIEILGLEKSECSAQMIGFNHFIYLTDFRYKGKDAYPILDEWIQNKSQKYWEDYPATFDDLDLSKAAVCQYQLYGKLPIGDTPRDNAYTPGWWFQTNDETRRRWYGKAGGFDSQDGWQLYQEQLSAKLKAIEQAAVNSECKATEYFIPKQSPEQIVPIINCLVNDYEAVFQVNIPNTGSFIPGFPEDLVVEGPGIVNGSGIKGIQQPAMPRKLMTQAMLPRWVRAEQIIDLAQEPDSSLMLLELLRRYDCHSYEEALEVLDELLASPALKKFNVSLKEPSFDLKY